MNITRWQHRVLHVLAQGGMIRHRREGARIVEVHCITREGMILAAFTMEDFAALRRKGLIASQNNAPYRISLKGRRAVGARADNR